MVSAKTRQNLQSPKARATRGVWGNAPQKLKSKRALQHLQHFHKVFFGKNQSRSNRDYFPKYFVVVVVVVVLNLELQLN